MIIPRIENVLAAEDITAASTATTSLETLFDFCQALEPRDRQALFKIGSDTESFVTRILELAQTHIELIPRGIEVTAIASRNTTRVVLRNQHDRLQPLAQRLDNTVMLIGADVLRDCLTLYKVLRAHGKTVGLEELLADIGQRFAKNRPMTPPEGDGTVVTDPLPPV